MNDGHGDERMGPSSSSFAVMSADRSAGGGRS